METARSNGRSSRTSSSPAAVHGHRGELPTKFRPASKAECRFAGDVFEMEDQTELDRRLLQDLRCARWNCPGPIC